MSNNNRALALERIQDLLASIEQSLSCIPEQYQHTLPEDVRALKSLLNTTLSPESQEKWFSEMFDHLNVGVMVLAGPDLVCRYCNSTCQTYLPRPEVNPLELGLSELELPEETYLNTRDVMQKVLETGEFSKVVEVKLQIPGGTARYYEYQNVRISWNGEPALMVVAWEVTGLVQQRLIEKQHALELEGIFNTFSDALMVFDADGKVVRSNVITRQILGFDPLALNRETLVQMMRMSHLDGSPVDRNELVSSRALSGEAAINIPFLVKRADGITITVRGSGSPLRGEQGEITGAVVIWHDVTELEAAHQQLQTERDLSRAVLEGMKDEVWYSDMDGNLTMLNNRPVTNMGFESVEELNRPHVELLQDKLEIFNPDGTPRSIEDAPLNRSLKGETVRGEELARHVRTRQLMHREYISSPIHSNTGLIIGAVAVVRDITEQKRIERELQFAMINLEQTNSELRDFAFIASHDLQEPLRKVTTFSREIIDHHAMSLDETGRDYLHRMADAARRMQEMLVSLLDYSRINTQGVPFVRVNLNEVVQGVLSDLEVRIAQVHAEVAVEALPEIDADPMQMRQLMQNLLSNALKYYPEGQSPTIRVWYETLQDTDQVRLFIQDNGIGFEEEYRDLIFQPFRRLHGRSAYEGTGMGLAICRKIVDRHHGAITASSALGQGATFMVILPRRQYSGSA